MNGYRCNQCGTGLALEVDNKDSNSLDLIVSNYEKERQKIVKSLANGVRYIPNKA